MFCKAELFFFFFSLGRVRSWVSCGVSPNVFSTKKYWVARYTTEHTWANMLGFLLQSSDFCFLKYLNGFTFHVLDY